MATVITPALVHTGRPRYKGQDDVTKARPGTSCALITHVCESKVWVAQGHSTSQIFTNKDSEIQPNIAPHSRDPVLWLKSTKLEEHCYITPFWQGLRRSTMIYSSTQDQLALLKNN